MKTVMIWNEVTEQLRYTVFDGDLSEFNHVYIDFDDMSELSYELNSLVHTEVGMDKVEFLDTFPIDVVKNNDCVVIEAGIL